MLHSERSRPPTPAPEAASRESEERLRFSLEAGRLGFWQHDLATDELICSDLCKEHFGRRPDEPLGHPEVLAALLPDDRMPVQEAIRTAVRAGVSYVLEYRVRWPDGSLHWLMVRGRASYDPEGRPVRTYGVTLDITERKESEARQQEFIAMLAHELRNPLAPVLTAIEILRLRPGEEREQRARSVIERQVGQMSRLIDDLLDVSRITTGKITLRRERLDLAITVGHAVDAVRAFIDDCGHTLEVVLPDASLYADADPLRLEQIVSNLLNNAAKYTERGGVIRLSLAAEGEMARISIRDTGIGIPTSLLDRVFDLFTQGERSLERSQGGLGLGLALVRGLVHLHGGTVEALSDGPGAGSEFVVRLPLSARISIPSETIPETRQALPVTA